jgi:uncharacterized caspase-like protein
MRTFGAVVLAAWLIWFFGQPAFAEKRVALVMGNAAYQNVNQLANPANDAVAMSETLKSAGFDVVELKRNLNVNEMRRALRNFSDIARDADFAIVYFAGHGIEIDGTNYLIPIDATLERDIDAFDEAISLDRILTVVEPARQLRLVILDACRDNPFNKTMKRTIGARAIGRGLAKVEPASPNTLIAFAAKAGSTANDGDTNNSPFTAALVKYLPRPGLDLRKAFGFTRDDVLKATNNRQEPFIYGSLGGDDVALVPAAAAQPAPASAPDPNAAVRRDYELAERVGTKEAWDLFLLTYPDGFYAKLAQAQHNKLAAEDARVATTERARLSAAEQPRLAAEGAKRSELEKAAEQANAAPARVAAETKALEDAKVAESERIKVATQVPDGAGEAIPKPAPPAADLPRALQIELSRVGCNTGAIDGTWNAAARRSLSLFNKNAGTKLDVKVASLDALEAVKSKSTRICPSICEHGFKLEGDSCNRIICRMGFEVGDDNACQRIDVKKLENPLATLTPPRGTKTDTPRNDPSDRDKPFSPNKLDDTKSERATSGKCSSIQARCAVEIGGRCTNGHWEFGRNGAGGTALAFDACIVNKLAAGKR